jgi:hypothetical protein
MINVNKITSTLAKLQPDSELQQYVQMHKNDPYIVALGMLESNRRKELRDADQAANSDAQEQPTVVDQMVAQMAPQQMPEDQGIGQLPAGDMNFAGGGIIAFADGGDVERYQFGGNTMGGFTPDFAQAELASSASALQTQETQRAKILAELEQKVAFLTNAGAPQAAAARAQLEAFKASGQSALPAAQFTPAAVSPAAPVAAGTEGRRITSVAEGTGTNISPNLVPASARAKVKTDAPPTANNKAAAPGTKPAAPVEDKGTSGLDALINKFTRETDLAQGTLRNQRAEQRSLIEQTAMEDKAEGEKRRAARGDVFAKKEGRLAEREKDIAGLNDKYTGLALLQAGAAMMSTPGNLGSVIGKGVQVGSERYIAGIDKINAAKDKFAEARDRLDDLRLNRDDMNEKEIRDENRAIRNSRLQGLQLIVDGAGKDLEISNANQKAIFGVAAENILADKKIKSAESISRSEIAARERIAQIPQGQERIASLLGKGDLAVGLAKFAEIQAGKFNPTTAYTDYISKRKEGDTVLTPQEFVTQIRSIQALMGKAPPTTVDTSKPDRQ